jgi:hypothetical protein
MASLVWCESATAATQGFEEWTETGGTVTTESTTVKYGQRSIKLSSQSAFVRKASVLADAGRRITAWFNIGALPTTEFERLIGIQDASSLTVLYLVVDTVGKLRLVNDTDTSQGGTPSSKTGTQTVPTATWFRVSVSYTITATNNWAAKVYYSELNGTPGTLDISATNSDFNLLRTGSSKLHTFFNTNEPVTAYVMPVYVDDGSDLNDPGDIRTIPALYATESATNFDTAIGAARSASDYNNVNERPLSETNGWQQAAASQVAESYLIQQTLSSLDVDITGKTIVGRLAWLWAKKGSDTFTPCTFRAAIAGTGNTTTGGTLVIPAGTATGDSLFVCVTSQGSTSGSANVTCTDNDAGGNTWTTVTNTADKKAWLFWKRATSATASKTITIANGVTKTAFNCVVMQGAATSTTPYINVSTETNASGDETHATFTPSVGGCAIMLSIHDYGSNNAASTQSTASLGAMTERAEHLPAGAGADCANSISTLDGTSGAAAATGSITWAQTDSTTYSIAWACRPEDTWAAAAAKLIDNGSDVSLTLTTTSAFYSSVATSAVYPSGAFGIKSTGTVEDTFFYEGGVLIVYNEAANDAMEWISRLPVQKNRYTNMISY